MKKEHKTVAYDETLQIEAYRLDRITQPFPNHFHEYYVIGFVARGGRPPHLQKSGVSRRHRQRRPLPARRQPRPREDRREHDGLLGAEYPAGDDAHADRGGHGQARAPGFTVNVLLDEEVNCYLRPLHEMIMAGAGDLDKEENLLLLISLLLRRYGQPFSRSIPPCRDEIECACRFIEEHYAERLSLEEICRCAGLSKSTLLRAFSREKGLTPYSYLENIRISEAKKLLGQGVPPLETALRTGFSDQSHFTNYFRASSAWPPAFTARFFWTRLRAKSSTRKTAYFPSLRREKTA